MSLNLGKGQNQRHLRAVLQNDPERVLSVDLPKKLYQTLDELQKDLVEWLSYYNNERTHQGKMCNGRAPVETLIDGERVWAEKNLTLI